MQFANIYRGATEFSWEQTLEILAKETAQHDVVVAPSGNYFIVVGDTQSGTCQIHPPFLQAISNSGSVNDYLQTLPSELGKQLLLLVRAGAAAMGIWENGTLRRHKVITKYMVRKKQGKAQITYANKKGKSRLGARLRLRKTREFFVEINGKLREWQQDLQTCTQFLYSCPVRLWSEIFTAKVKPPVLRKDPRWRKIPLYVNTPNFKELQHIFYVVSHGRIVEQGEQQ